MDTGILWSLIGSFTNVFILTRIAQYFLKRFKVEDRKRAFLTFFIVAALDLIGLYLFFKQDIAIALHGWLFYYLPFFYFSTKLNKKHTKTSGRLSRSFWYIYHPANFSNLDAFP